MGFLNLLWKTQGRQRPQIEASIENVKQRFSERVEKAQAENKIAAQANVVVTRRRAGASNPLLRVLEDVIRLQQEAHERHGQR